MVFVGPACCHFCPFSTLMATEQVILIMRSRAQPPIPDGQSLVCCCGLSAGTPAPRIAPDTMSAALAGMEAMRFCGK